MAIANPKITKKNDGTAQAISTDVIVFNFDHINKDLWPKRDENKIKMNGNIPFLQGKYVQEIYATSTSISLPKTSEGDEDMVAFTGTPEFSHPGSSLELEEFIALNTNKPLGVAFKINSCSSGTVYWKVYGSPCNPLSLIVEGTNNKDGVSDLMKFQQFKKSKDLPGRYYGTWQKSTSNVVDVDAFEIDVSNGSGEYQLSDNSSPIIITDIINPVDGTVYTIIGSGGINPATIEASNSKFLLKGGVDWQGLYGSKLTVKSFFDGTVYTFIEQSRT